MKKCSARNFSARFETQIFKTAFVTMLAVFVTTSSIYAQQSKEELAQEAANPLADLMSFPFQNNLNINQGEHNRNTNILNIQPVLPFANGRLITRTILPILWIPDYTQPSGMYSEGLGDMTITAFYAVPGKGLTWGLGPVFEMPTGGEKRGSQKWGLGPSFVALAQPGRWTFGVLVNNVWSVAGKSERADVNKMLLNLFLVYQLGNGWYVNSTPILTSNWKADSGDKWTVPLGGGFGKLSMLGGKLPLNLQTQFYSNVVRPDNGPEFQWRVQVQVLLPSSILGKP
jgi:hypothetical protein